MRRDATHQVVGRIAASSASAMLLYHQLPGAFKRPAARSSGESELGQHQYRISTSASVNQKMAKMRAAPALS